mgnify:CR=1 FL=1
MYKMVNNLVPRYLRQLCPHIVEDIVPYNLRNREDIRPPGLRTETYRKSFLPSCVRIWNDLDLETQSASSLSTFKYMISQNPLYKKNKLYSIQTGRASVLHTRIRLGLSALNNHRFNKGFIT